MYEDAGLNMYVCILTYTNAYAHVFRQVFSGKREIKSLTEKLSLCWDENASLRAALSLGMHQSICVCVFLYMFLHICWDENASLPAPLWLWLCIKAGVSVCVGVYVCMCLCMHVCIYWGENCLAICSPFTKYLLKHVLIIWYVCLYIYIYIYIHMLA
jgi:hypothetical protein